MRLDERVATGARQPHNQTMSSVDDRVAQGAAALARGDWTAARGYFEASLKAEETPAALEGLSDALFWLEEIRPSIEQRTRACLIYQEGGDTCRAARAALWNAMSYFSALGNSAAGNGWLQRAERLLEDAGPCAERGWLVQLRGKMMPDAVTAVGHAREALEIARHHGDLDLEVWALSEQGRGLVSLGDVDAGLAMLDEAVAAATAGGRNLIIVGDACCNMLSACDRAADFARAVQWCEVVDAFARRYNSIPIFHYCRVVYCGVLIATGRWVEAERELQAALRAVDQKYPTEKVHSLSRLALLCVRRGRFEEAGQLLSGLETHGVAAEASAALHLARGQAALAGAVLERRLDALGDGLPAVPLLRLLVEVRLALGEPEAARAAAERLRAIAERAKQPPIHAQACLCAARVERSSSSAAGALFEKACALFEASGMPFDTAVTRLEWAQVLATADRAIAAEDARLAEAVFTNLGARPCADRAAALLRELGAGSRPGPRATGRLTSRERQVLDLVSHGLSNLEIGARLFISPKTVEHHVGRILSKLGLRSRTEAVAWALRNPSIESGAK
jgi:DNA-binding CsgD family transcriptional regulator